jgi:hypothetical protein
MTRLPPYVLYNRDPELRWDLKAEEWIVLREFRVSWCRAGKSTWTFTVPAGFRNDLASIPKRLRGIIPQVGRHLQAAIAHDWCYTDKVFLHGRKMTRAEADQLFLDGMMSLGVPWLRRKVMYSAVRVGGRGRWG